MFFEDVAIGDRVELGSFLFTTEAIRRFAVAYDPQPFHMDERAGEASHFKGLIASGWHVAAVWMKLMVAWRQAPHAALLDEGGTGRTGPSPGFRDMIWAKPVRPGDTLFYYAEASAKKESASRPEWGIVIQNNGAFNQKAELVFRFTGSVFWRRRGEVDHP